jgi:Tol biopolymer transport system component
MYTALRRWLAVLGGILFLFSFVFALTQNLEQLASAIRDIYRTEDQPLANLVNQVARDYAWAPDQQSVVFTSNLPEAGPGLYISDRRGKAQAFPAERQSDRLPAWSPDGRQIAFVGQDNTLYTAQRDGSARRQVSNNPDEKLGPPVWSPDGQYLAYIWNDQTLKSHLDLIKAASLEIKTDVLSNYDVLTPVWAPDSQSLLFTTRTDALYIYSLSGELRLLSEKLNHKSAPVWAPDGKTIAFVCEPAPQRQEICLVQPDGNNLRPLTQLASAQSNPVWSPDGAQLAFISIPFNDPGQTAELLVAQMSGGDPQFKMLARNKGANLSPVWSPDSKNLLFISDQSGSEQLYQVSASGGDPLALTNSPYRKRHPVWLDNGQLAAFELLIDSYDYQGLALITPGRYNGTDLPQIFPPIQLEQLVCPRQIKPGAQGQINAQFNNLTGSTQNLQAGLLISSAPIRSPINFSTSQLASVQAIDLAPNTTHSIQLPLAPSQASEYVSLLLYQHGTVAFAQKTCKVNLGDGILLAGLPLSNPQALAWLGLLAGAGMAAPWLLAQKRRKIAASLIIMLGLLVILSWLAIQILYGMI